MEMDQLLFYFLAALIIFSGIKFLTVNETIHAVLYFFLTLMSTAGLFFILSAPFVAAMQILVYGGAITVLILFVVMLTTLDHPNIDALKSGPWQSGAMAGIFLVFLSMGTFYEGWSKSGTTIGNLGTLDLARVLFKEYVIPFEIASILLLAALIGAIYLAMTGKETE